MVGKKKMTMETKFLSESDVNTKIQEIKDAETKKINDKATAKSKLKALGLTDDEVEALQG